MNLDLELASLCNLKCPFCFWGEGKFNAQMFGKKKLMPTEMALRLIDDAAALGIPALKFNWRGESTIHPDFSVILKHARSWKRPIRFDHKCDLDCVREGDQHFAKPAFHDLLVNTNANCKDHAIDGLMAATKVMVSLDSVVPEIYKVMRVGGDLSRAIEIVRELIRRGHPNLWIRRVIANENRDEPFKMQVDELFGGKGYRVADHFCFSRNGDSCRVGETPWTTERVYCGYPSQRIMVASDGTAYPCCVDFNGDMPMGNVRDRDLLSLWNGPELGRLRRELRGNTLTSETCRKCTSWMAYKDPRREYVQDQAVS
jgi:radical SAM protein with 4Fe4S-binding SPASM domain